MKRTVQTMMILFLLNSLCAAQVTVSGEVSDEGGLPLPGANVMLRGTYEGATIDCHP